MTKHVDSASIVVIAVTFVMFATAVVVKGLGHDLLLEAGVFLVSVKLILMAYKNSVAAAEMRGQLQDVREAIGRLEQRLAVLTPPARAAAAPPPAASRAVART